MQSFVSPDECVHRKTAGFLLRDIAYSIFPSGSACVSAIACAWSAFTVGSSLFSSSCIWCYVLHSSYAFFSCSYDFILIDHIAIFSSNVFCPILFDYFPRIVIVYYDFLSPFIPYQHCYSPFWSYFCVYIYECIMVAGQQIETFTIWPCLKEVNVDQYHSYSM